MKGRVPAAASAQSRSFLTHPGRCCKHLLSNVSACEAHAPVSDAAKPGGRKARGRKARSSKAGISKPGGGKARAKAASSKAGGSGGKATSSSGSGASTDADSGLRALTVKQPFASAIMSGVKQEELRGTKIFNVPPLGLWVALHAGKGGVDAALIEHAQAVRSQWQGMPEESTLPKGAILGFMHVSKGVLTPARMRRGHASD